MWRLAYETGMRQGERLGLTNSEIQLIDNVICIVVEWQLKVYNNVGLSLFGVGGSVRW